MFPIIKYVNYTSSEIDFLQAIKSHSSTQLERSKHKSEVKVT